MFPEPANTADTNGDAGPDPVLGNDHATAQAADHSAQQAGEQAGENAVGNALARHGADAEERPVTELVEQPAKVMRIGSMIKQLLEEVRNAPLDDASRERLKEIHARSITELEDGLAPELVAELERLSLPFNGDSTPSDAELRIAQAQLVGWLEGLFHGIQTTLFAQQMAARAQLEEMQRHAALGPVDPDGAPGIPGATNPNGPYL